MKEVWKTISGFEDYQVSNLGRIKRSVRARNNHKTQKVLRPGCSKGRNPRPMVVLYKEGTQKTVSVGRIVLITFTNGVPFKGAECNHKDGDRKNNCISNLEWVTGSQNVQHALKTGLRKNQACGERVGRSKLKDSDIPKIREMINSGMLLKEIGDKFGVRKCAIFDIKHKIAWTHVP